MRELHARSVAEAAHGFDQLTGGAELGTKPLNVHVDSACLDVGSSLPNDLQEKIPWLHPAFSLGEEQ